DNRGHFGCSSRNCANHGDVHIPCKMQPKHWSCVHKMTSAPRRARRDLNGLWVQPTHSPSLPYQIFFAWIAISTVQRQSLSRRLIGKWLRAADNSTWSAAASLKYIVSWKDAAFDKIAKRVIAPKEARN